MYSNLLNSYKLCSPIWKAWLLNYLVVSALSLSGTAAIKMLTDEEVSLLRRVAPFPGPLDLLEAKADLSKVTE